MAKPSQNQNRRNMAKPSQNRNRRNRREYRSRKSRQFKGIRMRKWGKWVSEIRMPHSTHRIWLGSYDTPEMAARAYDFGVYCLRGSKAKFNFSHSLPQISNASSLSPPQIQAAAAKYATGKFPLPSEDAAFSTSLMETECPNDRQEMSVFWDSVPEDVDNGETITLEDFPPEWRNDGQEMSLFWDSVPEDVDNGETITLEDFPPECRNDGQEMSVFQDSVPEDVDNGETITLDDFPPWDVPMEDFEVLFPRLEKWGSGAF